MALIWSPPAPKRPICNGVSSPRLIKKKGGLKPPGCSVIWFHWEVTTCIVLCVVLFCRNKIWVSRSNRTQIKRNYLYLPYSSYNYERTFRHTCLPVAIFIDASASACWQFSLHFFPTLSRLLWLKIAQKFVETFLSMVQIAGKSTGKMLLRQNILAWNFRWLLSNVQCHKL